VIEMDWTRWILVVLLTAAAIAFITVARGREHHRGDEVGALGPRIHVVRVEA
jgi:hypothetical protein